MDPNLILDLLIVNLTVVGVLGVFGLVYWLGLEFYNYVERKDGYSNIEKNDRGR